MAEDRRRLVGSVGRANRSDRTGERHFEPGRGRFGRTTNRYLTGIQQ